VFRTVVLATLLAVSIGLFGPTSRADGDDMTVENLMQKVLDARGGAERWAEVRTLKVEGIWTAFSEDMPLTILRMRPDLYRFEHVVLGSPAVLAYDGESAWVQGALFGAPNGQEIADDWKRNVIEETPFVSKLLDHAAAGATTELAGRERVEGREVYVLKVGPKERPPETWHVDGETFLETKRVSTTFDFFSGPGVEIEMETYYMDYRDVGGVKIPHREERHFGTRYNVIDASSIETNPDIDAALFKMPVSEEKPDADTTEAGS
jgi:hypothetical protein